jgi:hypothetical protein
MLDVKNRAHLLDSLPLRIVMVDEVLANSLEWNQSGLAAARAHRGGILPGLFVTQIGSPKRPRAALHWP